MSLTCLHQKHEKLNNVDHTLKEALEPLEVGDAGEDAGSDVLVAAGAPEAAASLLRKDIWFNATDCLLYMTTATEKEKRRLR